MNRIRLGEQLFYRIERPLEDWLDRDLPKKSLCRVLSRSLIEQVLSFLLYTLRDSLYSLVSLADVELDIGDFK